MTVLLRRNNDYIGYRIRAAIFRTLQMTGIVEFTALHCYNIQSVQSGSFSASEMAYIMSGGTLNSTHSLTPATNIS